MLHKHARTGAETSLLTIRREDKNEPLSLEEALSLAKAPNMSLAVNAQSGRAALLAPASSFTLEDGRVEERIRLIRPLSRDTAPKEKLAQSQWRPAEGQEFEQAWLAELDKIPATKASDMYLVSGLLLPVWKHLPRGQSKVYRLETDEGERVIGRLLQVTDVPSLRQAFNLDGRPMLSPADALSLLLDKATPLPLRGDRTLKVSTVMGAKRIELMGFSDTEVEQLKSFGFFSEIISWRLRLFLPHDTGTDALERLFALYPPLASAGAQ